MLKPIYKNHLTFSNKNNTLNNIIIFYSQRQFTKLKGVNIRPTFN